MKSAIAFYVFLGLFVLGFGLAGPTDGGTLPVCVGTIGFLGLLVATWIRIARGTGSVGGGR